jgi:LysR family hydrogen peroxide-inducible transcriptional activator
MAIVSLPVDDVELTSELLFEEDLMVIAPVGHPLATRDRVDLRQLSEHELLLEPPSTTFRDDLDAQAAAVGVELRAQAEVDGIRLLATLAFEGYGPAVLPASAHSRISAGGWKRVELDGVVSRSVGVVARRRGLPSAPARAFREVLTRVIAEQASRQPGIRASAVLRVNRELSPDWPPTPRTGPATGR